MAAREQQAASHPPYPHAPCCSGTPSLLAAHPLYRDHGSVLCALAARCAGHGDPTSPRAHFAAFRRRLIRVALRPLPPPTFAVAQQSLEKKSRLGRALHASCQLPHASAAKVRHCQLQDPHLSRSGQALSQGRRQACLQPNPRVLRPVQPRLQSTLPMLSRRVRWAAGESCRRPKARSSRGGRRRLGRHWHSDGRWRACVPRRGLAWLTTRR